MPGLYLNAAAQLNSPNRFEKHALARLDGLPLAQELLLGVSVYRLPVDMVA
jgi:hypothetical protein